MPKKLALVIGVSEYGEGLEPLPGAVNDADAIKQVLENQNIGGFDEIELLINPDLIAMQEAIEKLFSTCKRDDLVLLFFAGHGITDDSGKLYLTTRITPKEAFKSKTVHASFVHDVMNNCRSKRQIVILDCCYSGAFAEGWRARSDGSVNIKQQLGGEGRAVLTSSTGLQTSFESEGSGIYTRYLVEGIRTGAADIDKDGFISIDELHEYAKEKVQEAKPAMKPELCLVEKEGFKIIVAKAPKDDPKLEYRRLVENYAKDGSISVVARNILSKKRGEFKLSTEEAKIIEDEVLEPFRQRLKHLEEYEECLRQVVDQEKPLRERTRKELKDYQEVLGLRDEDIALIYQKIIPEVKVEKQVQEVDLKPEIQHQQPEDDLSSERGIDYTKLRNFLAAGKWEEADKETAAVMLKCMNRQEEGWLDIEHMENFPCTDLRTIDQLWVKYSNGRFGFSVQKRIWIECVGIQGGYSYEVFRSFTDRVGWSRFGNWTLQINYSQEALMGHLPLPFWVWIDRGDCVFFLLRSDL